MKTYTHSITRESVQAIASLYEKATAINAQLNDARKAMSAQYYQAKEAELFAAFRAAALDARVKVRDNMEALKSIARDGKMKSLLAENAEEEYKLLSLPVTLTEEELAMLLDRHQGNSLFTRAVKEYVQKRDIRTTGIYEKAEASAMAYQKEHDSMANINILANYLDNYAPTESTLLNERDLYHQKSVFAEIENSGLLAKLDTMI